jgi:hypothetical protein
MKTTLVTALCAIAFAAAPFDPQPLTESQRVRLETADDGSHTVDEAALYALLENAADWSEKEAGAVVPDYDAIRRDPAAWRGTRCVIEGTIELVIRPNLSRAGWEKVEGIVLRVDHSVEPSRAQDFVVVYLTEPPVWTWWNQDLGLPQERGQKVRVVARAFKTAVFRTKGEPANSKGSREYLTFVGRRIPHVEPAYAPKMTGSMVAVSVVIGLTVLYLFWRVPKLFRGASAAARPRLHQVIEQRRHARQRETAEPEEETPDLPQNPAEALDRLADTHRSEDQ